MRRGWGDASSDGVKSRNANHPPLRGLLFPHLRREFAFRDLTPFQFRPGLATAVVDAIFVDIETHETMDGLPVLRSYLGGFDFRLHLANRLAFRQQPALPETSTLLVSYVLHAAIVQGQNVGTTAHG